MIELTINIADKTLCDKMNKFLKTLNILNGLKMTRVLAKKSTQVRSRKSVTWRNAKTMEIITLADGGPLLLMLVRQ